MPELNETPGYRLSAGSVYLKLGVTDPAFIRGPSWLIEKIRYYRLQNVLHVCLLRTRASLTNQASKTHLASPDSKYTQLDFEIALVASCFRFHQYVVPKLRYRVFQRLWLNKMMAIETVCPLSRRCTLPFQTRP